MAYQLRCKADAIEAAVAPLDVAATLEQPERCVVAVMEVLGILTTAAAAGAVDGLIDSAQAAQAAASQVKYWGTTRVLAGW
jgi:hypothetical protein